MLAPDLWIRWGLWRGFGAGLGPITEYCCGCSSVVERHVANVNVDGSNPFTRFLPAGLVPAGCSFLGCGAWGEGEGGGDCGGVGVDCVFSRKFG